MKAKVLLPILTMLLAVTPLLAQGERGKAEATINGKSISIDYGQPDWGGSDRLAAAPTGFVWRVGMNQATQITTAGDLSIGGKTLAAGKYTLWAKRTGENTWTLGFHPKTGVWGAPALKDGYVAELPMKMTKVSDSAEKLNIALADKKGKGELKIHWGPYVIAGDFGVK
jgi:hypothetical protein